MERCARKRSGGGVVTVRWRAIMKSFSLIDPEAVRKATWIIQDMILEITKPIESR